MTLPRIDHTHEPSLTSWVASANGHADFPIQNLPLGVFSPQGAQPRIGVAIGDSVLDLAAIASLLPEAMQPAAGQSSLNALFALPPEDRTLLRRRLSQLLSDEAHRRDVETALHPLSEVTLHLPARIGDYTDFYVGIHHATNVGKLFRPDNPLLPNYKYVPIGYHGRASSVRPSGEPVVRPRGQRKAPNADVPVFEPSARLDYELELGIWVAQGNALGTTIPIGEASEHIAGLSLLNDWSARDLQAWEYQPLGPFLAKNFHTTISPWVVTAEALAPYRIAQPARPEGDPAPLPYLLDAQDQAQGALSLTLSVWLSSAKMREEGRAPLRLSQGPASNMYWTLAQIVAHHASGGCNLNPGDLLGTGTISGPTPDSYGSLLEITEGGKNPFTLPTGETRSFLQDGDEISITASAHAPGRASIGFGECRAVILATPA
ncbi:fumarylacetoacetase [Novosphingobium terrae]|uniref:fumarylacetoacetase n=1 Tax=Novosphingobium terrae TaxID=2726189 RepID=UPI00197DD1E1|nr:fumarylacetoacetase [Novosphingobium terrae]